jgi:pimeloyl-ACP methyl ester carboxylesterase
MKLFFRQSGQGQPLIILHGLLGSSDNWFTLAKKFSENFSVYLVDQRNHGQSPHSDEFDYKPMTEDLEEFIRDHQLERPHIIGHSMGGKTAMNFAIKHPDQVGKLIVVDIVPKPYFVKHDRLIDGLEAIPLQSVTNRTEAEKILSEYEQDPAVRQFLLKNLSRDSEGKFFWKVNLPIISKNLQLIGADLQYTGTFDGPSLFIHGSRSDYFKEGDDKLIQSRFTNSKFVALDTGHWVQAEKPQEFAEVVLNFLNS